jgi:hypothetical protein
MSTWYVIVDANGRYLPHRRRHSPWVRDLPGAEVFTGLKHAKNAMQRYVESHPGCRIERIPRLPDRIPR